MKDKQYAVQYALVTHHEAILVAQSKKEARERVIEIVGEPIKIDSVHKLGGKSEK